MILGAEIANIYCTACNTIAQNGSTACTFPNFNCNVIKNTPIIATVTVSFVSTCAENTTFDSGRTINFTNVKGLILITPKSLTRHSGIPNRHVVYFALALLAGDIENSK